jgi:hypothetical protein
MQRYNHESIEIEDKGEAWSKEDAQGRYGKRRCKYCGTVTGYRKGYSGYSDLSHECKTSLTLIRGG